MTASERPSIDHGILSPSGRVSNRSRRAALARVAAELFPNGCPAPSAPAIDEATNLRHRAAELRGLADRGMKPRAHRAEAARLEAAATELEHA